MAIVANNVTMENILISPHAAILIALRSRLSSVSSTVCHQVGLDRLVHANEEILGVQAWLMKL